MTIPAIFCTTLLGLALLAPLAACEQAKFHETRTVNVPHVASRGLNVETDNGDITATTNDGQEVVITATLSAVTQERLIAAKVEAVRGDDGILSIRVRWPDDKRKNSEGCSLSIRLPDATGVHAQTDNGAIHIEGLAGNADLHTSNGEVFVNGHAGGVTAATSNGRIRLLNVEGADAQTSNGAIELRMAPAATGPLHAQTSNGAITCSVGPAFCGELTASTSNGSINNHAGLPAASSSSKNHMVFNFPAKGAPSTLTTSNGSISLEAPSK